MHFFFLTNEKKNEENLLEIANEESFQGILKSLKEMSIFSGKERSSSMKIKMTKLDATVVSKSLVSGKINI